jgi:cell division septation protein DedD
VGTTAELFYVHVSSLKTRASALQEAERLRATDQPVVMRSVDLGDKGTWWRVYLGPYGVRADAQAAAAAAKAAGLTDYTQIHRLSSSQVEAGKG